MTSDIYVMIFILIPQFYSSTLTDSVAYLTGIVATTVGYSSLVPETKTTEFANSLDLDEVAHDEPPFPDLHCLSSSP